jgi:DNA-binding response OmpR family regulator
VPPVSRRLASPTCYIKPTRSKYFEGALLKFEEKETMSQTILVVDDERDILRVVEHGLTIHGYAVITAGTGREALEHIAFEQPDVVVLDIMMPVMDGFQVLQQIRNTPKTAELPVILLTAKTEEASVAKGWREGADLYLVKPFEINELIACVEAIFERNYEVLPIKPSLRK